MENSHDFGRADAVDAEAIGQPGQRRFRLMVRTGTQTAALWMEKQQLANVGEWLAELLERLDRERPSPDMHPSISGAGFGDSFDIDFRAGQIGLGYNEDEDCVALQTFELSAQGPRAAFQCTISRDQSRSLIARIEAAVAGGRAICPLCNEPMEPSGHVCPRSNGHAIGSHA